MRRAKAMALSLARLQAPEVFSHAIMPPYADDSLVAKALNVHVPKRFSAQDASDAGYGLALDNIERLDRFITISDSRRDAVIREMERRRDGIAKRAKVSLDNIIEAEFK